MSYNHFTISERAKLELLYEQGKNLREIGEELGKHYSSVSRELKRNSINKKYECNKAQRESKIRKQRCGRNIELTSSMKEEIEKELKLTRSPEQISKSLVSGDASFKSIYTWIYRGFIEVSLDTLRRKGKSQGLRETRGKIKVGRSIKERPKIIKKRLTFGHWELDTVVSGRGNGKGCVATFLERKTRLYWAIKMPDKSAESMFNAIKKFISLMPKNSIKTFTVDRGKEFSCYNRIEEEFGIPVYFADPYSSWQRGSNENANGLFREFYPKGCDLTNISVEQLEYNLMLINTRPRKCLGWKTSFDTFFYECCT